MLRHDALLRHPFDPASITDMIDSVYLPLVKVVSTPPGTSTPASRTMRSDRSAATG